MNDSEMESWEQSQLRGPIEGGDCLAREKESKALRGQGAEYR